MNTFSRILKYFKPYKFYIGLAIICSVMFAVMNGITVYLSSPLLDTLFRQAGVTDTAPAQTIETDQVESLTPGWITKISDSIAERFDEFVFTGSIKEILLKICLLILTAFFLKNLFGYLQGYFLVHVEVGILTICLCTMIWTGELSVFMKVWMSLL